MRPTIDTSATLATIVNFPLGNVLINVGVLVAGAFAGALIIYFSRKFIRKFRSDHYPTILVAIDGCIVALATMISSATEIYKADSWTSVNQYTLGAYAVMGCVLACGIGSKILLSVAKSDGEKRSGEYEREIEALIAQRDAAFEAESLLCEVMKQKLDRLIDWKNGKHASLEEALNPKKHIHVLVKILREYFARDLPTGARLRTGIYQIGEDEKTLEAVYGWDGANEDCFSNNFGAYMKITAPGGSRSVVVECWSGTDPFKFVPDAEEAVRQGTFVFFKPEQRQKIRSMVAYRHNMTIPEDGAFIITLDSDQPRFFSAEIEAKVRLIVPALAKRIELELLSISA